MFNLGLNWVTKFVSLSKYSFVFWFWIQKMQKICFLKVCIIGLLFSILHYIGDKYTVDDMNDTIGCFDIRFHNFGIINEKIFVFHR